MSIIDQVRQAGVVGAGGAGFPTHVKLNGKAEYVIANGAECEPLLRVDQLLMQLRADDVVRGMRLAMQATGASRGVIATKAHYGKAVEALKKALAGQDAVTLHLMDAYYPSGDEKSIIFEVTGRVVPSAKLPLDVGCVVVNVGTLANIADAAEGVPVTQKALTIGGDVPSPVTVTVPVGSSLREVAALSGFDGSPEEYAMIVGGPCMGRLENDWDAPVLKTTGGLLMLKRSHPLIQKRTLSLDRQLKLARAICCQCSHCTQLCPRNALGLGVSPHKAMRAFSTGNAELLGDPNALLACSSCGLCTNYACEMGLSPSVVMAAFKEALGKAGIRPVTEAEIAPDPFVALKRVPVKRLIARMGLSDFDTDAPPLETDYRPARVRLALRQHVGRPAVPVVSEGAGVRRGDVVAEIPEGVLGARVHASIDGRVTRVSDSMIEITGGKTA